VTATEHSNLFCVYKNIIVCKVPVMKQHNRYSDTGKNATIIRVVNGLALSMVTVFEDIFDNNNVKKRDRIPLQDDG
jgi:hypothetical protein